MVRTRWTHGLFCAGILAWAIAPARAQEEAAEGSDARIVDVRKIWDGGEYQACFTDLVRFENKFVCAFREGSSHGSFDGQLHVIESKDGEQWTSAAVVKLDLLDLPEIEGLDAVTDLRDPHLSITPDGRLMLNAGIRNNKMNHSAVWFSDDGRAWSRGRVIGEPNRWLWRPAWSVAAAYAIGYSTSRGRSDQPAGVKLYRSADGVDYRAIAESIFPGGGSPNETSLQFLEDGTALCLLRRDGDPNTAQIGSARPPYTAWIWKDLGVRIGGPVFLRIPDGRFVAAVRLYDGGARTSLCWLDPDAGALTEFLRLPSGGDTSYAGLVWHGNLLWISYYSSHEGRSHIYLARVAPGDR